MIDTFSVERLNNEFFAKYQVHYQRFTDYLLTLNYCNSVFHIPEIEDELAWVKAEKPIRSSVKKLLGRIVFLFFLQRKGWLGCPSDRSGWTDGDPNFLSDWCC